VKPCSFVSNRSLFVLFCSFDSNRFLLFCSLVPNLFRVFVFVPDGEDEPYIPKFQLNNTNHLNFIFVFLQSYLLLPSFFGVCPVSSPFLSKQDEPFRWREHKWEMRREQKRRTMARTKTNERWREEKRDKSEMIDLGFNRQIGNMNLGLIELRVLRFRNLGTWI
jgi:hypothetical protein